MKKRESERERKLGFPIVERASSVIVSESWGTPGSASPSAKGAKRKEKALGGIREQAGRIRSQFQGAGRGHPFKRAPGR